MNLGDKGADFLGDDGVFFGEVLNGIGDWIPVLGKDPLCEDS